MKFFFAIAAVFFFALFAASTCLGFSVTVTVINAGVEPTSPGNGSELLDCDNGLQRMTWNSLAPGGTFVGMDSSWNGSAKIFYTDAAGATVYTACQNVDPFDGNDGGSYVFTVYPGGTNVLCTTNLTWTVKNNDVWPQFYYAYDSVTGGHIAGGEEISGGGTEPYTVSVPCDTAGDWALYQEGNVYNPTNISTTDEGTVTSTRELYGGNSPGSPDTLVNVPANPSSPGPTEVNTPPPVTYNPTNTGALGTNQSPILFTSTNTSTSIQQGDSALFDAMTKGEVEAHKDALLTENALAALANSLSNSPSGGAGTNIFNGVTNVDVQNWPAGYSNYLSGILTNGLAGNDLLAGIYSNTLPSTNGMGSNGYAAFPSSSTNSVAALAAADAAQGDYGVDALIASLNPSIIGDGVLGSPDMTMSFCGTTIDFDPNHEFPSVTTVCLSGFKVMLLLAFLIDVGNMFWKLIQVRASTQTGGVPNLQISGGAELLGFGGSIGGNFIGAILAAVVSSVFIVVFALCMSYLFSNLGINVADAMATDGFENSMGNVGLYLLTSFFPVHLFFTLLTTRIALMFGLGKLLALATAASRFLWGK